MTIAAGSLSARAAAQQADGDYTFHVYVDPIYGDDAVATALNPQVAASDARKRPLGGYPTTNFPDPNPLVNNGQGVLQHAPYSFRTLTGPLGARNYIDVQNPSGLGLPWPPNEGRTVRWVVIHCLPGLYGPDSTVDPTLSDYDVRSRMRYNGEEFPVELTYGISLQGTSALDTIFDGRGRVAPIITATYSPSQNLTDHFVDGLTVRGSVSDGDVPFPSQRFNLTGTGIYIGIESGVTPLTVSNCFIVDNAVGIAIESRGDGIDAAPRIVNNTIAWNRIGIWSGNRFQYPTQPNVGWAVPVVVDNVFDTRRPDDPDELQRSPFLGLHPDDLTVLDVDFVGGGGQLVNATFNAWDAGRANVSGALTVSNYPPPALRSGGTPPYPSPVDIGPYMGTVTQPRGVLYVNDAFRVSIGDLSPHDFRLSPQVVADPRTIDPQHPISAKNPLVNVGIDLGDATPRFQRFRMVNGEFVDRAPGLDVTLGVGGHEADVFHAWDWDGEGFGNPRIRCRAGFASFPTPPAAYGNVDLGADEMDSLIIAGYVPFTRMFAVLATETGTILSPQTTVYFFNLVRSSYRRPVYSGQLGQKFNWWDHTRKVTVAEGCLDCVDLLVSGAPMPTNLTLGRTVPVGVTGVSFRGLYVDPYPISLPPPDGQLKPPILRNLECDYSPQLLSDWHHFWGGLWFNDLPNNVIPDVYAANPWWGDTVSAVTGFAVDNFHSYSNPAHPTLLFRSDVTEGTLNAPGTYPNGPRIECGSLPIYVPTSAPILTFGPFCSGGSGTYSLSEWGFGDASGSCPDILPLIVDWWGARYNCQSRQSGGVGEPTSNLQSFLSVIGEGPFVEDPVLRTQGSSQIYPGPRMPAYEAFPPPDLATTRSSLERRVR